MKRSLCRLSSAPRGEIMRTKLAIGMASLLCGTFISGSASAQVSCPTFPGTQSSGCSTVINITNTGASMGPGPATGPYDGSDDTLVGIVNNTTACALNKTNGCNLTIYSIDLSSSQNICGFDGDGIDTFGAPSNPRDATATGYGGPRAFFTPIPPATSISPTQCRVNFNPPLKTGGDNTYFSLENALSASTACTNLLNGALQTQVMPPNGPNICASFTPKQNYTLQQAAALCGPFSSFNWTQQVTSQVDPSEFYARNVAGGFDASVVGSVRLTSKRAPWADPPQAGGYAQGFGGGANPDNSYPFYYDPNVDWPGQINGTPMNACTLAATANMTLMHHDAPADKCLPGGADVGTATCTDPVNAPGLTGEPAGSLGGYETHLVFMTLGPVYAPVDTGIGFKWTSNYSGTTGGVIIKKTSAAADNNGPGGVTITSVSNTSTYTGVSISAINGVLPQNALGATSLLAAVLPESRSAHVNDPTEGVVTAFATIINTGANNATACSIAPATGVPVTFHYRPTNPTTNAVIGTLDTPIDIPAGQSQSFVFGLTANAAVAPTDMALNFSCTNTAPAPIVTGLNTLQYSGSITPVPDLIALVGTHQNDGIVHVTTPAQSNFVVATDNLGSADTITVATNTGSATLPVTITTCQTNPSTGVCLQTPAATVVTPVAANATPTFAFFVTTSNTVAFDPANNRIFVTLTDSTGAIRGETSLAVETQ
jgi:hypothetical protein